MSETKYGKYLLRRPIGKTPHLEVTSPIVIMAGENQWKGARLSLRMSTITQPFVMESKPHLHEYDAYMGFVGGTPLNCVSSGKMRQI